MSLGVEAGIFLAYAAGLMIIYFFGKALVMPLQKIVKLLINSVLGGIVILLINTVGNAVGIAIPLNMITAVITGLLGIPGVAGLLIYFNNFS